MKRFVFPLVIIALLITSAYLSRTPASSSPISSADAEAYLNEFWRVFDGNMTQKFGSNSTTYAQHTNYEVYVTVSTVRGVGIEFFPSNETHFNFETVDVPVETGIFPNLGFNATLPPTNQSTVTWDGAPNGTMNEIGNSSNVIIQGGLWVTNRAHFMDLGENGEVHLFDVTVDGRYYYALILRGGNSLDYWNQNAAAKDASIFFETQSFLTYQQAEAIKESMSYPIFQTILSQILWKDRNALQISYTLPEHDADIAAAKELAIGTYHFQSTYVDEFYKWIDQITPKPLELPQPAWYETAPWSWILGGIVGTVCYEIAVFPLKKWSRKKSLIPRPLREHH